jgi:hypothetical protein
MESMNEPTVKLNHNRSNVPDKLHMMPIQRRDAGEKRLLRNWKRNRERENTKQRVKVAEDTKLDE